MRLIDADKLKAVWIRFKKSDIADGGGFVYDPDDVIETIDESETVEAEPVKHGRWEFKQNEKYTWCFDVICSACKNTIDTHTDNSLEYKQKEIKKRLLYCPNCGAKMDLVGEKNERV